MPDLFQNHLNRIFPSREWSDISGYWLRYIDAITPPGSQPSSVIEEFIGFETVARTLHGTSRRQRQDVAGFRQLIFHEAIYLLHKASHVIGCSETDASLGAHTWALSQAYQGSFFAAKSICYLLGGVLADYDRKTIIIDLWPGVSASTGGAGLLTDTTIEFFKNEKWVGHKELWQLFQHFLRTTKVNRWPTNYVDAIVALAPNDFAKQRNIIHYEGGKWVFDDLFEFTPNNNYGLVKGRLSSGFVYDEKSDFTFVLAQVIFRMALLLLSEIITLTNKLEAEISIFNKRLDPKFHPYYITEFPTL